jgi:hypothetical protein
MKVKLLAALCLAGMSALAHAGTIVGGSNLLDNNDLNQLETWLGAGQLTLTNVYTKAQNDTAWTFHAAVDNQGPTFVVLQASADAGATWYTVGGYDPKSWNSTKSGFSLSTTHDAFLFNLDSGVKYSQVTDFQTVDSEGYGPTFGSAYDLWVNSTLKGGQSFLQAYSAQAGDTGQSIVDATATAGRSLVIGQLEVFTIAALPANVPEPASLGLVGLGFAGLAAARRKGKRG